MYSEANLTKTNSMKVPAEIMGMKVQ